MAETESENQPLRRRSARLSPLQTNQTNAPKMAPVAASADTLVKRSITVRKIAPRKTTLAPSQHNKENTPKRAVSDGVQEKKQKVKNPKAQTPGVQTRSQSPKVQSENPDQSQQPPPTVDPEDAAWSHKVRRSYSRLSEKSFTSPNSRLTLFGFEKLQTPEVMRKGAGLSNRSGLEASGSFSSALASFTSLLEAEDCAAAPDLHIPGVVLVKEKRRRRKKVQQIDSNEMDALAAKMNAEFEEAEDFELLVE
uniref:Cell division cycle associated 5 n=1 Tax=Neogobius melanostomus TaxID=47308 RepID=A0A8C6SDP0_9GOBI